MVSTGGYWYQKSDLEDGGNSTVQCNELELKYEDDISDCLLHESLQFSLDIDPIIPVDEYFNPWGFALVGFDLGQMLEEDKEAFDLTPYSGIFIEYVIEKPLLLKIISDEVVLGYAVHEYLLDPADTMVTIPWHKFEQPSWAPTQVPIYEILQETKTLHFEGHSDHFNGTADFEIKKIEIR